MSVTLVPNSGKLHEHAAQLRDDPPLKLPAGKTEADALKLAIYYRKELWGRSRAGRSEDQLITALNEICTSLCCGDRISGRRLATRAIYGGG